MTAHILEHDARHRYQCVNPDHKTEPCHGVIFESVTTILGKSVPKNLAWHGQTRGVIGVKGLLRIPKYNVKAMKPHEILVACIAEGLATGMVMPADIGPAQRVKLSSVPKYDVAKMSPDAITEALKREHLTVNDHRDQAAEGGTLVHKALEDYAEKGIIPSASAVPESKRGSMAGLAKFIIEYRPEFLATEVRVLSVIHKYAGTFDLLCRINDKIYLIDLKTSKWIYPSSHFPQLEAYEGARVEAGEEPTDVRAVLWVNSEGNMELVPSTATFADFLALKASAEVIGRLDRSWKRPRKARRTT